MVKVSAKTDYACRALLELSLHWPSEEPVHIQTISERQKIPEKFLTQILLNLKQMGYVQSIRGKKGGYVLIVEPGQINLATVLDHFGNESDRLSEYTNQGVKNHVLAMVWKEIDEMTRRILSETTFEDIRNRKIMKDNVAMFEI